MATNVDKDGTFAWSIGGVKVDNDNDIQDSSSGDETRLEQTYAIDLSKMSDPIKELDKKSIRCRYTPIRNNEREQG